MDHLLLIHDHYKSLRWQKCLHSLWKNKKMISGYLLTNNFVLWRIQINCESHYSYFDVEKAKNQPWKNMPTPKFIFEYSILIITEKCHFTTEQVTTISLHTHRLKIYYLEFSSSPISVKTKKRINNRILAEFSILKISLVFRLRPNYQIFSIQSRKIVRYMLGNMYRSTKDFYFYINFNFFIN